MQAVAASSPVAIHAAGRYPSNRRGHGGHRVRGPHAPPAAPSFTMGKLPRRGARAMDTDTPPDPRGVPYAVALEALTAPELVAAYRAARNGDIPKDKVLAREREIKLRAAFRDLPPASGGSFLFWGTSGLGDDLENIIAQGRQDEADLRGAASQLRKELVEPAREALEADFQARVRDGRIIASWIDLTRPELGARDYAAEVASLIVWPNGSPKLGKDGPVLTDLRYRRAQPMPPAEGWDLGEASFALLPELDKLAWDSEEPTKAVRLLGPDLLRAIFARNDLRIIGRDADAHLSASRIVLPRDYAPERLAANTFVWADILDSAIIIKRPNGKEDRLANVRVEADPGASVQNPAPAAEPAPLATPLPVQIPLPVPAKRESAASRAQRLAAIISDIQARAAASPERPDESRKKQFARLNVPFPGMTHAEHGQARGVALAAYPAWTRAGRRAG